MSLKPQLTPKEIARLTKAYRETIYEIEDHGETIQLYIGQSNRQIDRLLTKANHTGWAIITAFNPYSQCLSESENRERHQNLLEYVRSLKLKAIAGINKDPSGDWVPEISLMVIGIERQQAIAIGQKYQQNAVVFGELGQPPELLWIN